MAKILMFDIETAPKRAFVWGLFKQNVGINMIESDMFVLCWRAKWYDSKKMYGSYLKPDEVHAEDDSRCLEKLYKMMDEADIIVGHNGDRFDIPTVNSRFVIHGWAPPSPYKTVDTLKLAKRHFKFTSNKLDFLGQALGCGRKIDTGGFGLWDRCLQGDKKAMKEMYDYNEQDVLLLEDVYTKLRPYASIHPHVDMDKPMACPKCGGHHMQKRGFSVTNVSKFQRYQCQDCGGWARGRENLRDKTLMKDTLLSI